VSQIFKARPTYDNRIYPFALSLPAPKRLAVVACTLLRRRIQPRNAVLLLESRPNGLVLETVVRDANPKASNPKLNATHTALGKAGHVAQAEPPHKNKRFSFTITQNRPMKKLRWSPKDNESQRRAISAIIIHRPAWS